MGGKGGGRRLMANAIKNVHICWGENFAKILLFKLRVHP